MSTKRTLTVLAALPTVLAVGAGAANAAPGQPGLAAPNGSNPGLTAPNPAPAAPASPAQWVPDAETIIPAPNRAKPQQQTWVQPSAPQADTETDTVMGGEEAPAVEPAVLQTWEQGKLRVGDGVIDLTGADPVALRKAQGYLDMAEWQIAAFYDSQGFSAAESDRRAASTVAGAVTGTVAGAAGAGIPAAVVGGVGGALIGGTIGGIAGAAMGAALLPVPVAGQVFFVTTGVAGTAIGALAGAAIGAAVLGVPATVVGGAGAGVLGGAAGNALGGGTELAQAPTVEPLVEVAAPAAPAVAAPAPAPVVDVVAAGQQFDVVAEQVSAVHPVAAQAVTSLTTAIEEMPMVDPATFGAAAAPINDVIGAIQAVVAPGQ